jgi:hypothetical protein
MEEIRNKVAESGLINLDIAIFKPIEESILEFDIANHLWQGLVLKEKDFRAFLSENDWTIYQNKNVYIICSADAIVPTWAYMLVASKLQEIANLAIVGSKLDIQKALIEKSILEFDTSQYIDERFIIKGCSDIVDPAFAMVKFTQKLQPIAKSIMYGEPCSTVPVYKKPRK